jgi:hypothetical protein
MNKQLKNEQARFNQASEPIEQYKATVTQIEDLVEFHPALLVQLSAVDREALSQYYFAGRKVDVDDLAKYRDELVANQPDIEAKAHDAWAKLQNIAKVK